MDLWILHADTPYRMYKEARRFSDPALHVDETALRSWNASVICFAFWADKRQTDEEAWQSFLEMRRQTAQKLKHTACRMIYSVEDARILSCDPASRLACLFREDIRILTPFWSGVNRFGGAYDTKMGLTPEGHRLLTAAVGRGMLLDVSHASRKSFSDISDISHTAHQPLLATHSNFYAVTPHPRNLTDEEACCIAASGGIIGLSLVPAHTGTAPDVSALFAHIDHGIALGLSEALAIGGDFDGTDTLACSFHSAHDLATVLLPAMAERYHEDFTHRFFYRNARERLDACLFHNNDK